MHDAAAVAVVDVSSQVGDKIDIVPMPFQQRPPARLLLDHDCHLLLNCN